MKKKCPICGRVLSERDFSVHYPKCENRKRILEFEEGLNVKCPLCNKQVKKSSFNAHWLIHFKKGETSLKRFRYLKVICPFCGDIPKDSLSQHVRKYH